MNECVITGCKLIIPEANWSAWGDLHVFQGTFLFQFPSYDQIPATYNRDSSERQIRLDGKLYYEVNKIIIFESLVATPNNAALKHMAGTTIGAFLSGARAS